jgi:hypothetical protein
LRQIHEDAEMKEMRNASQTELRERWQVVLRNLGDWLAAGKSSKLVHQYEEFGRMRFEEQVPLHETVRVLHILRNEMIDFLQERCMPETSVDVYAEEELEQRVTRFFDELVFHLIRGYESAMKMTAHVA